MTPLEEAVKLLEKCKTQLEMHNSEYHHHTKDGFLTELKEFIAKHKKTETGA
jgi:hypothetical protein